MKLIKINMKRFSRFIFIAALAFIGAMVLSNCAPKQPIEETQLIESTAPVYEDEEFPTNGEIGEMEAPEAAQIEIIKREIKTIAEGEWIKYQEESFYSANDFLLVSEMGSAFESRLVEEFINGITGVEVLNCGVELDPTKKSSVLQCDIKGALYNEDSYDMHFLLNGTERYGFDLYGFQEYERKLVYEGELNDTLATIVFEFPYAISHCHEHVWPK